MNNKPNKKAIKPVDLQGDVLNSLSAAVRASEHALNVASSAISSNNFSHTTDFYNSPNNSWITPCVTPYTAPYTTGTTLNLQQFDTSNIYPKVDIEKVSMNAKANPYDCVPQKSDGIAEPAYEIKIYLAGVDKNRVQISLTKSSLSFGSFCRPTMTINILAIKNELNAPKERNFTLKESKDSFATRSVMLPEDVNVEIPIKAKMKDGVLSFRLPIQTLQIHPEPSKYQIDIT